MSLIKTSLLFRKHDYKLRFSYISPGNDVDPKRYFVLYDAQESGQRVRMEMRWERTGDSK